MSAKYVIAGAACLATMQAKGRDGHPYKAGVVRIKGINKIILMRVFDGKEYGTGSESYVQAADPKLCPDEIRSNPAFNAWDFAAPEETVAVIHGKLSTEAGASLGSTRQFF